MDLPTTEAQALALLGGEAPATAWETGEAARWIADALARGDPRVTVGGIRQACKALNDGRGFEHTRVLGEAWQANRGFDVPIARRLAQALIDLGALDAGEALLRQALPHIDATPAAAPERPEAMGLLARIAKQRFVQGADLQALIEATHAYLGFYRSDPRRPFWHGVNAAALLARQVREQLPAGAGDPTADDVATELHAQVGALWQADPRDVWLAPTMAETCLVLGRCDEAELWTYRFVDHDDLTAFALDSFDRQLREIWQARPLGAGTDCPSRLARILARHAHRRQQRLTLPAHALATMRGELGRDAAGFERNFSGERTFGLDTLRQLIDCCAAVGCVSNGRGERLGTGFVVAGDALAPGWGAAPVFVTNAHVIGTEVARAIAPADASVSFEAAAAPGHYPVAEVLYSSPPGPLGLPGGGLDVTIVRLQGLAADHRTLELAPGLPRPDPQTRAFDDTTHAFVVGHPRGSGLQISLHDSRLLDIDDERRLVHYRTPTDPGSSGSPVFNSSWRLIALHHGGSDKMPRLHGEGTYAANEGISLDAIQRRLREPGR